MTQGVHESGSLHPTAKGSADTGDMSDMGRGVRQHLQEGLYDGEDKNAPWTHRNQHARRKALCCQSQPNPRQTCPSSVRPVSWTCPARCSSSSVSRRHAVQRKSTPFPVGLATSLPLHVASPATCKAADPARMHGHAVPFTRLDAPTPRGERLSARRVQLQRRFTSRPHPPPTTAARRQRGPGLPAPTPCPP